MLATPVRGGPRSGHWAFPIRRGVASIAYGDAQPGEIATLRKGVPHAWSVLRTPIWPELNPLTLWRHPNKQAYGPNSRESLGGGI